MLAAQAAPQDLSAVVVPAVWGRPAAHTALWSVQVVAVVVVPLLHVPDVQAVHVEPVLAVTVHAELVDVPVAQVPQSVQDAAPAAE